MKRVKLIIIAAIIALPFVIVITIAKVKYGDPQAVWLFCDIIGVCSK